MKKVILVFCVMILLVCSALAEDGLVIFDNSSVSMIAKSMESNNNSITLNVLLENKSDLTVMFSTDEGVAVNGMEVTDFFAEELPPHTKKNTSIVCNGLAEKGVKSAPATILLSVRAYDSNDWSAADLAKTKYTISVGAPDQTQKDVQDLSNAQIVANNDNVTIAILGYTETFMGKGFKVYIENKAATSTMFTIDGGAVNGFAIDPFWANSVMSGCAEIDDVVFLSSSLEENGIVQLQEIRGTFHAYDDENWAANHYVDDAFCYVVK